MPDFAVIKRNVGRMIDQGAPEADIETYLAGEGVTAEQLRAPQPVTPSGGMLDDAMQTGGDVAKSLGSGVVRGAAGIVGVGGDLTKAAGAGMQKLEAAGVPVENLRQEMLSVMPPWLRKYHENPAAPIGSAEIMAGIDKSVAAPVTAYEPKTTAGRYARTIGEFAPGAAIPGSMPARVVAGVVAPAVASEAAGQLTRNTAAEPIARIAGALAGGLGGSGAVAAANRSRSYIPGMSGGASRVLEQTVMPGAEARLAELGPDAFLFEGSQPSFGIAQTIATRPGKAQEALVSAVRTRQSGANARLASELDTTLGPAQAPSGIEQSLEQQRTGLSDLYRQVSGLNETVNLRPVFDQLRMAIPEQAGSTQSALRRVLDMVAPQQPNGQRAVRTSPREVLNVRQAIDDELARLADQPRAARAVGEYRKLVDNALADAIPDIKVLDETFSNLMRESEALGRGGQVLKTGPEAVRPEDLIAERAAMTLPQREAMRHGTRAEIDRLIGTKANDVTALKQLVQSEGDWNRAKLAEIFGGQEADRVMRSIDREAAFQEAYRKLVENSQTAQRLAGAKLVEDATGQTKSLRDVTLTGLVAAGAQKAVNMVRQRAGAASRAAADEEIARAYSTTGPTRDDLIRAIRDAHLRRKKGQTRTRDMLVRALLNAQSATVDERR